LAARARTGFAWLNPLLYFWCTSSYDLFLNWSERGILQKSLILVQCVQPFFSFLPTYFLVLFLLQFYPCFSCDGVYASSWFAPCPMFVFWSRLSPSRLSLVLYCDWIESAPRCFHSYQDVPFQ
jgi:hypothetical protein